MQDKESPKKKNLSEKYHSLFTKGIDDERIVIKFKKLKQDFLEFIEKLKTIRNVKGNNFELGKKHYSLGNFDDAVMRFKMVTWLDPNYADGWYWLGKSYIANSKKPEAVDALKKALALRPNWPEAQDMLKMASS
jgi:tetratricopeptide (TPR) repeat protein